MSLLGIGLDLMAVMITFVILIGVLIGKKNAMNEYFPILLLLQALTLFSDIGVMTFEKDLESKILFEAFIIMRGSFVLVSITGFNFYIDKIFSRRIGKNKYARIIPFVVALAGIIFWMTSLLHGLCWTITDDVIFEKHGWYWVIYVIGAAIVAFDLFRVVINHTNQVITTDVAASLYIFMAIPFITLVVANYAELISLFFASITISYLIMYIAIHVHSEQVVVEKKMDDTIMQTDLIISQLQPHFMFNSLTNIKYLTRKDPLLAENAVEKFTKYLRANLEAIEDQSLISFADELEHTKNYIWLEQLRFKHLKVEYSVDVDDFLVPRLSLQPVVENAVKHGVTKKIGGGTIQIMVRESADCYKIIVRDDGVGFDQSKTKDAEVEENVGLVDIRKRLLELNKSTINIASTEGVGTTVTYKIMKGDK